VIVGKAQRARNDIKQWQAETTNMTRYFTGKARGKARSRKGAIEESQIKGGERGSGG